MSTTIIYLKQFKSQVMNSKQINARAKAAGGYITVPVAGKNFFAEAYYHHAIVAEFNKMLAAVRNLLKKHYTAIRMQNAPFQASSDPRVNAEKLMRYIRIQYQPKLIRNSERIIAKYLAKGRANRRDSILKALRKLYKDDDFTINFDDKKYVDVFKLIAQRNAELITNVSDQTISNVENIVYNGVTTGQRWKNLEPQIYAQTEIAGNRIKRIARDQTAKLNEAMNQIAQTDAGVEFFEWQTADDERVSGEKEKRRGKPIPRGSHVLLDGKIYKWGDNRHYPEIDTYGTQGVPGERVNCRCTAVPIILRKDYEAKQTSSGDWIITKGRL